MDRIKSKKDIDTIFKTGSWQHHGLLKLLICPCEQRDQSGRVAFIAGKKTGGAVMRNKAKRMMREAFRLSERQPSAQCVFIATSKTKDAQLNQLITAINKLLDSAGV